MYHSVVVSIFTRLCSHRHSFQNISITPEGNPVPINPILPPPKSPATTNLLSVSVDLPILHISYSWNPTVHGLPWLASLTQHSVSGVSPRGSMISASLLFHVWIGHILSISSPVEGHLDCLHFGLSWKIMLRTFVYMFLCEHRFSVFLDIFLIMELLGHIVTPYLTFWGTAKLFSPVAGPFYIPTSGMWRSQFLHIFVSTYYYLSFLL